MVAALGRVVVLGPSETDPAAALIGRLLTDAGAEVAVTPSSEAAALSVEEEGVAVVVVTDGTLDLVAGLRSSASRKQRSVAVVVVLDTEHEADEALRSGADSVLIRPVEADRLVETVTRLV